MERETYTSERESCYWENIPEAQFYNSVTNILRKSIKLQFGKNGPVTFEKIAGN